jgi:signal transduction histidine kinase
MPYDFITNIESCYYNIPALIYYSHIPTALLALVFGSFVFLSAWRMPAARALFLVSLLFFVWSAADLILWLSPDSRMVLFFWSGINLIEMLTTLSVFYFAYLYLEGKYPSTWMHIGFSALLLGYTLFIPTATNIPGFNYSTCEATQGYLINYFYFIEALILSLLTLYLIRKTITTPKGSRGQTALFSLGVFLFAVSFTGANLIGSALALIYPDDPNNWKILQYGLFGMPLFLALLGYAVVKFKAFNIKLAGPVALVFGLWALVFALFFVQDLQVIHIVVGITLVLLVGFGVALIRSVKREIAAREHNELLAKDLAKANTRLRELDRQKSEFVSIASHQLRSPLTAIRGYASMLLEGSYGKVPAKAAEVLGRIQESSGFMATSIEDFLNVSRIEQGRMKYELTQTDIRDMAAKVAEELKASAAKKGIALMFDTASSGPAIANIDPGKMRQVIYNLIDNALKYTPTGSITVSVFTDNQAKIITLQIKDTGVGMSTETQGAIFDKFVRAKNANSINVSGTGLGLYVAKQMIEAMQGRISATSPGEGKGSTFTVVLPMVR